MNIFKTVKWKDSAKEELHILELVEGKSKNETHCGLKISEFIISEPGRNEQEARDHYASIGRDICGTCVSHLYFTKKSIKESELEEAIYEALAEESFVKNNPNIKRALERILKGTKKTL